MAVLLSVSLYVFILCAIVFIFFRKHPNSEEFLIAERKTGTLRVAASLFTMLGGSVLVGLTSFAYLFGFSSISLLLGFGIGFVGLAFLIPHLRKDIDKNLFHTLSDYFYVHYGKVAGALVVILSFIPFFTLFLVQFVVGARLIEGLTGWPYFNALLLTTSVVAIYLIIGGFKSVLVTDVIQGVVMLIFFPFILWLMYSSNGCPSMDFKSAAPAGWDLIISLFLTGLFGAAGSPDLWQRIYTAKDDTTAKKGLWIAAILYILFGLGLCWLGLFIHSQFTDINPDDAFIKGAIELTPLWTPALIVIFVFSCILSTADTEIFLLTSILTREISRWKNGYTSNREASLNANLSTAKWLIAVLALAGFVCAIYLQGIVSLLVFMMGSTLITAPVIVIGIFTKLPHRAVSWTLIINVVLFLALIFAGKLTPENLHWMLIPAFVITLISKFVFKGK